MRSKYLVMAVAAAAALVSTTAFAQGDQPPAPPGTAQPAPAAPGISGTFGGTVAPTGAAVPGQDTSQSQPKPEEKKAEPVKLPWHGSTFFVSQYATTQTVGIGGDYQSSNPLYAYWIVFAPRYYVYEDDKQAAMIRMRFDVTLEATNSDATTRKHEAEFGNIWLLGGYSRTVFESGDWKTKLSTGPRVLFPTSKGQWNAGTRLMLGWSAGASQNIPLAGKKSTWFPGINVNASAAYTKYINQSTTPQNSDFERQVQDTGGRVFTSNQFSPTALTNHQVMAIVGEDLQIHEKLTWTTLYYWIMNWAYTFPQDTQVALPTGNSPVGHVDNPQNFKVSTWFYTTVDYELIPEVSLGLGYYNWTSQIGPDGTRRNPLWSPDAVVFFDVTANLDELYLTIAGRKPAKDDANDTKKKMAFNQNRQAARQAMLGTSANNLMFAW
ncbi:MAG: hypothetical protein HY898_11065 [Deltaproteobacteria bacterium]|nr:hypothetical protein [Deltaproteobacteria bacterium]